MHFKILSATIIKYFLYGPLAQLVEQLTLNQRVAGSSPSRPIGCQTHENGSLSASSDVSKMNCAVSFFIDKKETDEYGASKTGFLIQFWKLHLFCFRLFYFFQLSTNSWFSLIQSFAACCGSFPLLISNMTFSISFSDQWKLSNTL